MPAASATGSVKAGTAAQPAIGVTADQRDQHRAGQAVDPAIPGPRDPVGEHDVGGEQAGVGQRERDAERLALELHAGEQVDAGDGERERGGVARVRAPIAASTITGRNSIAATVASGSRSIAM